ncbi:MAG: amidohydrolase family protein, partial [Symbiobacteriaceae bacterium]|nr:amidohydrolase family protein [Symbiobacteriaceae bacterium]
TGASLLHPGSRGGVEAHINNTMGERSSLASTLPEAVWLCPGINPHSLSEEHLTVLREVSQSRQVVGLKIYAGYYHIDINSPVYEPVYRLAAEYGLPVAVHTGDTFAENGLMEYSHPLHMDRLAVTWRDVTFVMCHMGAPWVFEGCEIAYKNRNVYLDLSGLLIGDSQEVQEAAANRYWVERYQQPIVLLNQYEKLLFGTDWPLAPMADYIHFIATLIPEAYWQQVFYDNATKIYRGIV